jgi:hypothetical protein
VSDINWPFHEGLANSLVWIALCLLGADGLVQWVRQRYGAETAVATPSGPDVHTPSTPEDVTAE